MPKNRHMYLKLVENACSWRHYPDHVANLEVKGAVYSSLW